MFCGRDIIQLNNYVCNLFSEKMVFYWDMLSLGMKNKILGDTNGTSVITVNCNWISLIYLQICESLNHP
jgi:hypothetical protein